MSYKIEIVDVGLALANVLTRLQNPRFVSLLPSEVPEICLLLRLKYAYSTRQSPEYMRSTRLKRESFSGLSVFDFSRSIGRKRLPLTARDSPQYSIFNVRDLGRRF
jgi:hypothetical protein